MAQTLGIVVKPNPRAVEAAAQLLVRARTHQLPCLIECEDKQFTFDADVVTLDALASRATAMVAVGGDGTFLRAARAAGPSGKPLAGVNLGHLGFLAEFEVSDFDALLDRIVARSPATRNRTMLQASIAGKRGEQPCGVALNDVVVAQGLSGRMVRLRVSVDNHMVAEFLADGLIVATATGSTAYSFSAGGPLVHAEQEVLILTPICSHTLSVRPLVIPPASTVTVEIVQSPNDIFVTLDGQVRYPVTGDERVVVRAADKPLRVLENPTKDFYSTLRRKLGWGTTMREDEQAGRGKS